MTYKEKIQTVIGLIICYAGIAFLSRGVISVLQIESLFTQVTMTLCINVLLCIALLSYIFYVERKPFKSVSLHPFSASRDFLWGLLGFVLGAMTFGLSGPILNEIGLTTTNSGIEALSDLPVGIRVAIAFTAGITEEILLRTYPIERIGKWTKSIWFSAILSLILFAFFHIPFWTLGGAIQIGLANIIWITIYVKTRSLWALIIMHILNDLFAFVLLPYLLF